MLDASYQAYKSVEIAGFVGWIRRSRRIRHEQRAQNPPSLRLNPFRHFRPLTAKDNFFRFFLKLIAIHRVVIFFK